jgi:hypothetical protein
MSEWWTYRLSDFLMFAPRIYYRLFELYNAEVWPAPLVGIALAFAILWLTWRDQHGRVVAAILAAAWLFVAWAYHWERYATINTAAPYYAAGFAAEALLLIWFGVVRDGIRPAFRRDPSGYLGLILIAIVALYPFLAPLLGRPWLQAEIFGMAPDPTVLATLGVLLLAKGRAAWLLPLPLPLLWCAISAATLWTMESPEAVLPAAVVMLTMAMTLGRASPRAGR